MIKFIIQYGKNGTVIREVECKEVFTHSWELHSGEKRYQLQDGQIWHSWAVYDSAALALNAAAGNIRKGMERVEKKGGAKLNEEELAKAVATIERLENISAFKETE